MPQTQNYTQKSEEPKFYDFLAFQLDRGFEVWLGMRSAESTKRKNRFKDKLPEEVYPPHEINESYPKRLHKNGVVFRLPILDWSTQEVINYVGKKNLNPLYSKGFDRVGCFPCLAATEQEHQNCFNLDEFGDAQKERIQWLEQQTGKKHEPANTAQVCMFCQI